ncbi:hypothetical protein ACQPZF_17530 [Actinosynnema sp. CS-041913]|uniref:hypothetical protein n=1 Tax=Actinosynnema sp. CS-041913 TaxID=3239917 RepID=UPI003D8B276A
MDGEIMARAGNHLYTFDGRVLEVFGNSSVRFHVRHMHLSVKGPDRKGNRTVEIRHGRPDAPGDGYVWRYSAAEWGSLPGLDGLLHAVRVAIDQAG